MQFPYDVRVSHPRRPRVMRLLLQGGGRSVDRGTRRQGIEPRKRSRLWMLTQYGDAEGNTDSSGKASCWTIHRGLSPQRMRGGSPRGNREVPRLASPDGDEVRGVNLKGARRR